MNTEYAPEIRWFLSGLVADDRSLWLHTSNFGLSSFDDADCAVSLAGAALSDYLR